MRTVCLLLGLIAGCRAADADKVRAAVGKALPLLQKAGPVFWEKTGCLSCHHHSLPAMAVSIARDRGFAVDEDTAKAVVKLTADYLGARRDRILQGVVPPGRVDTMNYLLFGLAVERVPGNEATDAGARYLKSRQAEDGRWILLIHRPPLESSEVELTAVTIRALAAYAPPSQREQYAASIRKAAAWLAAAQPRNTEESAFQILGLVWGGGARSSLPPLAAALEKAQRADGGWGQLPGLESDSYATGQALVALEAAGRKVTDPAYERGVEFLLRTQLAGGSWHVKSRAHPFQPYFESGFPHGPDQWISAAGTSWAAAALALTRPGKGRR